MVLESGLLAITIEEFDAYDPDSEQASLSNATFLFSPQVVGDGFGSALEPLALCRFIGQFSRLGLLWRQCGPGACRGLRRHLPWLGPHISCRDSSMRANAYPDSICTGAGTFVESVLGRCGRHLRIRREFDRKSWCGPSRASEHGAGAEGGGQFHSMR